MAYNATVYRTRDGQPFGVFVAEVDSEGRMLRSNAIQCTGFEGTPFYDDYIRLSYRDSEFRIVRDNCQGYRDRLASFAVPPAYLTRRSQNG